jgi:hypothetical protein
VSQILPVATYIKREKKRIAASRCRQKKQQQREGLETNAKALEEENVKRMRPRFGGAGTASPEGAGREAELGWRAVQQSQLTACYSACGLVLAWNSNSGNSMSVRIVTLIVILLPVVVIK